MGKPDNEYYVVDVTKTDFSKMPEWAQLVILAYSRGFVPGKTVVTRTELEKIKRSGSLMIASPAETPTGE